MRLKQILLGLLVPVFCTAMMSSQDLVELAKKEKARRAKIQVKKVVVVTNTDLKRVKTTPSTRTTPAGTSADTAPSSAPPDVSPETAENVDQAEPLPELSLEEKWRRADTRARHLDMQLTRLGQQFYSAQDGEAKETIQKKIDQAERELASALKETENLKAELDKLKKK